MLPLFLRVAHPRAFSIILQPIYRTATRRTLLTTAVRFEPATKSSTTAAKSRAAKTTTEKKSAAEKKPKTAKKAAPKAKKAAQPKKEKPKLPRLTKADLPPKQPAGPWTLFCSKYVKGLPGPLNAVAVRQALKAASGLWHEMSDQEKQPFYDEYKALRGDYVKRKEVYFANVSSATLRRVNERAKKLGKKRVKAPSSRMNAYALFLRENYHEAQKSFADPVADQGKAGFSISTTKALSEKWWTLSDEEKKSYRDRAAAITVTLNS